MYELSNCTVLIVDDTEANVDILVEALDDEYEVGVAIDGESALEFVGESKPDIILLDIMMPGIDGYTVCERLQKDAETENIPIIFLSALDEIKNKTKGFELGAVDYITKPFEISEVKARVKTHLSLMLAQKELANQNEVLEVKVKERTEQLVSTQEAITYSLAVLAEYRDPETGGHIRRTQNYVKALAEHLKDHERFKQYLDKETIYLLHNSAPLHDIGKVGVPDGILLKHGKLTDEEFTEMKKHTIFGRDAIQAAEDKLNYESRFLVFAKEFAYTHQEKWDGSGYPQGLKGDEIPYAGRLMAVADVYDALISKRVYKPPFTHKKAVSIIAEGKGSHFDPDIADAFIDLQEEFKQIALKFADFEEEREALNA